jgi:hypothetical protein
MITSVLAVLQRLLPFVASFVLVVGCKTTPTQNSTAPFEFGVIGDAPYFPGTEPLFVAAIAEMNGADLAFVLHVGDIEADGRYPYKGGARTCSDESFEQRLGMFAASRHPFILTPGDNDWTDCHFVKEQAFDPLERLEKLRTLFFADDRSLGQQRLTLITQASDSAHSRYVENRRWVRSGVHFVTLHIVGSNDNLGRNPEMDREHAERSAANLAWLERAFQGARAEKARALVIVMQADPQFATTWSQTQLDRYMAGLGIKAPAQRIATGFDEFRTALEREVHGFTQPVLLIHGDTHVFRVDKPLQRPDGHVVDHFTRLEVHGDPDLHWVRVRVDPSSPDVFSFSEVTGRAP